ncbi:MULTISPECIES: LysR substrate-binding domain-containing protein [Burkholderia cepacia complex]|uniref:LysR family transcriptional regulator n=1 Tax=Burkholderia cepacia TaxID=292 RepID=A0A0J5ZH31_BURCE|nr:MULTISPECIES: LysR substrate-binding domain-containing protein [Burkholderia cepacia complex]AKM02481.1 LysR family transcriptional regulator [Burkholderia pyrrocinia]KML49962.1 LysR family transcriptional regulator [Burkholderia cepacia]QVN22779.1 LysR family transcriptional regulator [Burkholderia pyrrocinia]GAU05547.1 LysR family transcriptional regulator [Burkholderia stabilis]
MPALNALKAFEMAGRTGSFTRAAELLNVTQSAVSRQVRQLEGQLGETLLERRHHQLELTAAGRVLLRALQQSFDKIELTVRSLQEKTHLNRLRANVPPTFAARWLMPRLGRLRDAHPEFELSLTTRIHDSLGESRVLDCAIRFGDGEWDGFDNALLMQEQHIAVCAPALYARLRQEGAPIDLNRFTLLHVLATDDQRYLTWQHWLKAAGIADVDTRGGYEFDLLDHAIRAAIDGLGITIADRHMVARELATGQLMQVLNVHVDGHQSYWFVTRPEQTNLPHIVQFRDWLQQEVWLAKRHLEPSSPLPQVPLA